MPLPVNLLDSSLGIQNVMDMPDLDNLPRARELASNALSEPGLEELYAPNNVWQLMERALCPDVGDGSMLNPEAFSERSEGQLRSRRARHGFAGARTSASERPASSGLSGTDDRRLMCPC